MKIDPSLFKQYDIRGVYKENLHPRDAFSIGQGYGTFIQKYGVNHISVGHDNRLSSELLYHHLIEGLLSTGCTVYELGLTLTPIIDFSWFELDSPASIMVTASHSPVRYNGFKFSLKKDLIFGEDLQKVRLLIEDNKFTKGEGQRLPKPINEVYVQVIVKRIRLSRKLNIVLDCGNGTGSILAPQLFHELGVNLTLYHCISNGSFPHHDPYPQKVEGYKDHFVKELKKGTYDLGIALDGDCDRMGFFDEEGNFIENDKIIYIHAKDILKRKKKATFVVNVAVSQAVIERIEELGGNVIIWKTGPPYMLTKMREYNAALGGEISGHVAFADGYFGFDDGVYTACRTLELVSKSKKPISSLFSDLPHYFSTPEFRIFSGEEKKLSVIEELGKEFKEDKKFEVLDVDGLRITTAEGWFLLRASQTEPLVTGRVEATSKRRLEELKTLVQQKLAEHHVILDWNNPITKH